MTYPRTAAAFAAADTRAHDILVRLAALREHRQARGMLPSEKMRKPATWTTLKQRDTMMLLELQHDVVAYETWPVAASIRLGRNEIAYHPSLGFKLQDGRTIALELLGERSCSPAEGKALEDLLGQAVREHGYGFVMMRERAVAGDKHLAMAREVVGASGWPVGTKASVETIGKLAGFGGRATVDELTDGEVEARGTVCVLVMRRMLAIDLRAATLGECVVRLPPVFPSCPGLT